MQSAGQVFNLNKNPRNNVVELFAGWSDGGVSPALIDCGRLGWCLTGGASGWDVVDGIMIYPVA